MGLKDANAKNNRIKKAPKGSWKLFRPALFPDLGGADLRKITYCKKSKRSSEGCGRCLEASRACNPPCFLALARFLLLALSPDLFKGFAVAAPEVGSGVDED